MTKKDLSCDVCAVHTEIVNKVKNEMLNEKHLNKILCFYKAISDNTRLQIINALDNDELCVCDVAFLLNKTKSAVSHQLKKLRLCGIIKNRKSGKEVYYSLADEHIRQIFNLSCKHTRECLNED